MKKVRMILSIAALLFAVAGALASNAFKSNDPEVRDPALSCTFAGYCTNSGSPDCEVGTTGRIYRLINGAEPCQTIATGTFHED